jgi:hypothetical protein
MGRPLQAVYQPPLASSRAKGAHHGDHDEFLLKDAYSKPCGVTKEKAEGNGPAGSTEKDKGLNHEILMALKRPPNDGCGKSVGNHQAGVNAESLVPRLL